LPEPIEQGKTTTLRAISIRLPVADIELAKKIAGKRGIGYQTLLKHAIREGLRKAG
jgi:predicted DNA binding CopG/RHH family protein